ncbi:solute symporter family protein [Aquisalibacillus elongatus]|uniref:Cation/acetate symporter n=1 Tax=Aquisalibacillus elongatus TaxID=485577 RepID=A0A3N5BRC7_9BACI|nr:cation acetate symporter [Aquisalibacillus elongatus]RPF50062.1 cation/acetate symporter [Aquisalibacillus elongatus]
MNMTYLSFFIIILIGTLVITHWAAERSRTTHQFYVVSGSLTGFQNGLAIAGDYISAASFLGITGLIAFYGYDGFLYATGFLISYVVLLLWVAEPVQRLGTYSIADVVTERFPKRGIRLMVAVSGILISVLYMIPQLVASGLLLRLLLGVDYTASVWVIGVLMTLYVAFGGMVATSWVQIIKTVLLMGGSLLVVLIVLSWVNWDLSVLIVDAQNQSTYGNAFFYPGHLFNHSIEKISLTLSLILGTSGLPHILLRFLTVKNAKEARLSAMSATWVIGLFYLMTLILGVGTIAIVGWDQLTGADPSGNLAALLLAEIVGGDFLVAFVMAVAFATIIAVVTGLVFAATSAFAYDIYHHIWKKQQASEKQQLTVARYVAVIIGLISIMLSIGMENVNVAFLVSMTFAIAASSIFPLLMLTFYWKRFNHIGAYSTLLTGFIVSLLMIVIGSEGLGLISLSNPAIVSIPSGFLGGVIGTFVAKHKPATNDEVFMQRVHFGEQEVTPHD